MANYPFHPFLSGALILFQGQRYHGMSNILSSLYLILPSIWHIILWPIFCREDSGMAGNQDQQISGRFTVLGLFVQNLPSH